MLLPNLSAESLVAMRWRYLVSWLAVLPLAGLVGLAASAQPAADAADANDSARAGSPTGGIEELVILGDVVEIQEAKVTDSAIAFDADEIAAKGISDIGDLSAFTPNLEIKTAFAGTNPTLFIRGVGLNDYLSNAQSSVAVYSDGVYMQSPTGQLFQLFDTTGIEVLRGPQGSVYGRNATAGAILVGARRPSGDFGGYSRTTYGRFNQFEQEGAVEFPILGEFLSARVSGRYNRRDGITRNRCATPEVFDVSLGQHDRAEGFCASSAEGNLERNVNNVDNWAGRGLLRFAGDDSEWILNVHGGRTQALATHFQHIGRTLFVATEPQAFVDTQLYSDIDNLFPTFDPTDGDPYAGDFNRTGQDIVELFGSSLTGTIELEDWSLRSITALEMNERVAEADTDASPNRNARRAAEIDFNNESTQLSQDLKAEWRHPDQSLSIVTGGLFLYEKLEADNRFRLSYRGGVGTRNVDGRTQEFDQTTLSWGVFSHLTWHPSETLTFDAGLRYNWDRKDFDLLSCAFTQPFRRPGPETIDCSPEVRAAGDAVETWTQVTGEASLTYKPAEVLDIYLKYSRGWKPGQFNGSQFAAQFSLVEPPNPLVPPLLDPADPESVDAFELGFKAQLFDDRVSLSGAAFIYRYEDLQVFRLRDAAGAPPVNELINAEDAQVRGLEIELQAEPIDGLFFNGAFGWIDSSYNRFTQTQATTIPGFPVATVSTTQDYSGSQLLAAPKFTFSGTVRTVIDLDRFGIFQPRVDFTWRSEIFFDPNEGRGYFDRDGEFLPRGTLGDDALPLVNVQLNYTSPGENIELAGWVRNLTDEAYKVEGFDTSNGFSSLLFVIGEPRTYGATMTLRF